MSADAPELFGRKVSFLLWHGGLQKLGGWPCASKGVKKSPSCSKAARDHRLLEEDELRLQKRHTRKIATFCPLRPQDWDRGTPWGQTHDTLGDSGTRKSVSLVLSLYRLWF